VKSRIFCPNSYGCRQSRGIAREHSKIGDSRGEQDDDGRDKGELGCDAATAIETVVG
jgi:hypothetical protein